MIEWEDGDERETPSRWWRVLVVVLIVVAWWVGWHVLMAVVDCVKEVLR